jgi:hypothetical protein
MAADGVPSSAGGIGVGAVVVLRPIADAPATSALDTTEFLDVDVDKLAGPPAL